MKITFEPLSEDARESVIDIFNYYIEHGFAAYPETRVSYASFDLLVNMCAGYPAVTEKLGHEVVGFGLLRAHNPLAAFAGAAEITCFITAEYTNKGIGSRMLQHLIRDARNRGISSILAGISSLNEPSIGFHRKNGFIECGRFLRIGRKRGKSFDVVWMQKMIDQENSVE